MIDYTAKDNVRALHDRRCIPDHPRQPAAVVLRAALGVWPGRHHGLQQELPLTHAAPGRVVQAAEERLHVLTAPAFPWTAFRSLPA